MFIPINLALDGSNKLPSQLAKISHDELVLIELQGRLEVEGDRTGQAVGKLTLEKVGSPKPTLLIGHHLLEGKTVTLPKPLAVLHRSRPNCQETSDSQGEDGSQGSQEDVSYDIVALVKRKIVFAKRPIPVTGGVQPGSMAGDRDKKERKRAKIC
ncbi:hypothetical protein JAAARDRAFT_131402 [Jaapia argillacea MUCL 33604]|uniref:Chromosome transmission fidelity protein 8 n=1 Tax=Jaapia argillacea MUCL 33604 TaxID=933084 RepID=A0A067Q3U7_9AGAM|nr:hypothetical protein JAAARDRAFT_131402 [Jaapia argillacea MUCL 33604]